jgi:ABC-type branched-subunit amino acid transport system substrate-binding protein
MIGSLRVSGLSLFWFLRLTSFAFTQMAEPGVTDSAIQIGAFCTLSGPASRGGINLREGLQTFFNHVNDVGGIHGRTIVLRVEDDGENPDQAIIGATRLLGKEGVFAIASTSGVGTTRALIDRGILTDPLPALASAALSRSLFAKYRKNVFFLGMPYEDQVVLAIEHVLKQTPGRDPKMGFLAQDSFLGEEVKAGFHRACRHYGLKVVGEELYTEEPHDFRSSVDRLWSAQADHIVLGSTASEAALIMRDASEMGWFPQFIGPSSTAEPEILREAGEGADGFLVVDYLAKPWEREPGVTLMIGKTQKYFPRKDIYTLHRFHILGYVSGLIIAEGLQFAGRELSREAFIEALGRRHNLDTHGLAGVIGYRSDSRLSGSQARILQFDRTSGGLVPLTDWSHPMIRVSQ